MFWTLVVVETLQWTPFAFLLLHMAYSAIPRDLREAAVIDGATAVRLLRYIELPLMAPMIGIAFFIRFIDGFRVFDNIYTLVGSGPGGSTASLSIYIYEAFFRQGAIGRAVAASVMLFVGVLSAALGPQSARGGGGGRDAGGAALAGVRLGGAPHQPAGDRDAGDLVQEPAGDHRQSRASGSRRRRSTNYVAVLTPSERLNIFGYLGNSLAISLIGSGLALLLALPAAHAIARGGFGRRTLLPLVVNLRAVPLIIFAIPIYMGFQWVGLLDTRLGLGLILTIVNLPLALVILVNALGEVPLELDEAARMDGAANWKILILILAPLMRPALVTAFIFGFITAWNEFLFGLMLTTREAVPVTVGASFFFASAGGGVQWGLAAAVMILAALPPMLLGMLALPADQPIDAGGGGEGVGFKASGKRLESVWKVSRRSGREGTGEQGGEGGVARWGGEVAEVVEAAGLEQVGEAVGHRPGGGRVVEGRRRAVAGLQRGDAGGQMVVGRGRGGGERRVGEVGAGGGEHQAEERRVRQCEVDVAEAGGQELGQGVGRGGRLARLLGGEKAQEALGGERGQEAPGVAEVVRGCCVADAGALGDGAQREALDAALGELGLGGGEQRLAQVAVMVGAGVHPGAIPRNLATVKIKS